MYDSDEVRDAVRREMWGLMLTPGGLDAPLPAAERAALEEARMHYAVEFQKALRLVLEQYEARRAAAEAQQMALLREATARYTASLAEIGESVLELLGRALSPVAEALKELAERLGALPGEREDAPPPWKRRRREPEIRPVHRVDAVAAGRHPASIQRTRIRGGRR